MCGRYSFTSNKKAIQQSMPFVNVDTNLRKSYNIAPTQHSYVVTNANPEKLEYITWGLIPHWTNDPKIGAKMINARSEGIESKPSFRLPIRKKRCLVLADSFYEWQKDGKTKTPFRIQLKNQKVMVFAGIWETWQKGDYITKSFSIITTTPNAEMQNLHNRMPVILTNIEDQKRYLFSESLEEIKSLLVTPPDDILTYYQVPQAVGSVKNNDPSLHNEVQETQRLRLLF